MTLEDFLLIWSGNSFIPLFFSVSLILSTLLGWIFSRNRGGEVFPWNYFYTFLIYVSIVPGVLAIVIFLYSLFFDSLGEKLNYISLGFPVTAMIVVLFLIQLNVNFRNIPGFNDLLSFVSYLFVLLFAMVGLDRLNWIRISRLPFLQVVLGFALILLLLRVFTKKKDLQ